MEHEPSLDLDALGQAMHRFISDLYPICRSITGDGVRDTLRRIQQIIPLTIHEVPSGTPVFDWTVPREWNIRDAYVKNEHGERVIDFQQSNLHVLNYSAPIKTVMPLAELRQHLFTLPDQPDLIPYRTSYYNENWGFCVSHRQMLALQEGMYEVCIDSSLEPGALTYGEWVLPGDEPDEVFISCHICHPSLCNDNLSGIAVVTFLAQQLSRLPRRYTYRCIFIPGTIGSITWLARNEEHIGRIRHGLVAVCLGDPGQLTYKQSRQGTAVIDRCVEHVLRHSGNPYQTEPFFPYGYDERQYCSPGFDLPVGCLMRTPHGRFPEYHTSGDNLNFVRPECLADSLDTYIRVISVLEHNRTYINRNPKCEPQLGKYGLYSAIGGHADSKRYQLALLWVLNLADGEHSLLDIADRSGLSFEIIRQAADALLAVNLLHPLR